MNSKVSFLNSNFMLGKHQQSNICMLQKKNELCESLSLIKLIYGMFKMVLEIYFAH
jgi:hypothetical protein